jgi:membrane fusion protein (multidrug efflux system)
VLYQLDPAPLQAAHASAQASVRKAESTLATARTVARRNAELVKIDAISQQVNDETQAAEQQAEADLGVARAAEQTARINLGYTRITSPITGWVELSSVTPGALVTANQATALTTVQQLDPIHVHVTQSSSRAAAPEARAGQRPAAARQATPRRPSSCCWKTAAVPASRAPHLQRRHGRCRHRQRHAARGGAQPRPLLMPGMYVRAVLQEGVNEPRCWCRSRP